MKIDSVGKPSNIKPAQGKSTSSAKSTSSTPSAEVEIGGLLSQLQTSGAEEVFDAAKVDAIKQAIAEGRFTINADAIAERLITSARELLDSSKHS